MFKSKYKVLCVKDVITAWLKCSLKPVPFAFHIQARLIIHKNIAHTTITEGTPIRKLR